MGIIEELKESFFEVSKVDLDKKDTTSEDVLERCRILCKQHGLDAEGLATQWEAFALNRSYETISIQKLDKLSDYLTRQFKRESQNTGYNSVTGLNTQSPLMRAEVHNSTSIRKRVAGQGRRITNKNDFTTPKFNNKKQRLLSSSVKSSVKSQKVNLTASPIANAVAYADRTNSGKVETVYNQSLEAVKPIESDDILDLEQNRCRIEVVGGPEYNALKKYKYMYSTIEERAAELGEMIREFKSKFSELYNITDWDDIGHQSQEKVVVCGRVCCESAEGKLNPKSVILEGGISENGCRVKLDLTTEELKDYSLFPGQIIAVEGMCPFGHTLIASKIYSCARAPKGTMNAISLSNLSKQKKPFSCFVASGPFSAASDLSFDPLEDLLAVVAKEKPDLLILLGPFVDIKHPLVASGRPYIVETTEDGKASEEIVLTFEEIYELMCHRVFAAVGDNNVRVLMMPSQNEASHHVTFPQPPLKWPLEKTELITMLPNPCTFEVNNTVFGVSTNDVIFELSRSEISKQDKTKTRKDRIVRLSECVLDQNSYFPIFPPPATSKVDIMQRKLFSICETPDILITPSRLSPFVKESSDILCLNPGQLTRGVSGGVYSKILINPVKKSDIEKAQAEGKNELDPKILSRTKVEIVRV